MVLALPQLSNLFPCSHYLMNLGKGLYTLNLVAKDIVAWQPPAQDLLPFVAQAVIVWNILIEIFPASSSNLK